MAVAPVRELQQNVVSVKCTFTTKLPVVFAGAKRNCSGSCRNGLWRRSLLFCICNICRLKKTKKTEGRSSLWLTPLLQTTSGFVVVVFCLFLTAKVKPSLQSAGLLLQTRVFRCKQALCGNRLLQLQLLIVEATYNDSATSPPDCKRALIS